MDRCFIFSKGTIKEANKQYNRTEDNFEITLVKTSLLRGVSAETFNHLDEQLEFTNFSELKILPEDTLVNVKGKIVEAFDDIGLSSLKKNKPLRKKSIIIQNEEMEKLEIDLWNDDINLVTTKHLNKTIVIINGKTNFFQNALTVSVTGATVQIK